MNDETKDLILGVFEASLEAQLRAVRRLRQGDPSPAEARRRKSLSQVDMAFDILKKARSPLHVSQILERIQAQFGVAVDRESLVSSSLKKWRVTTASFVQKRTPSRYGRSRDELALGVPRHRRGLARCVSPTTYLPARGAASARFAGLFGAALFDSDPLDQRRPEPQLERGIFSPFPLPVGAATVVSADPEAGFSVLPATAGRRGSRRYPVAQNGPVDSAGVLSARSHVSAVSPQSGTGSALLAGLPAGAAASQRRGGCARFAHSL